FITAPALSPVFAFTLTRLVSEFLNRCECAMCSIVDIGCGDGALINSLAAANSTSFARFFGVDRNLGRVHPVDRVSFVNTIDSVRLDGPALIFSNELFDAFPFVRLVQRDEHLHELWVTEREGSLDWSEHEAPLPYEDYFASHSIELENGQFADVSLDWEAFYADVARRVDRGVIVTIDYGYPARKLFH